MGEEKIYVVRSMKAKCSEGTMENYLNVVHGHGVLYQGEPLLNANDHYKGDNLTHFGDCNSKKIFEDAKKQADEKYKAEEGDGFFTRLGKGIAKGITKAAITVKSLMFNKCELETPNPWIFTNEEYIVDGAPALTMESQCACLYGGIISIVEQLEEVPVEELPEQEEPESTLPDLLTAAAAAMGAAMGAAAGAVSPMLQKAAGSMVDQMVSDIEGQIYQEHGAAIDSYKASRDTLQNAEEGGEPDSEAALEQSGSSLDGIYLWLYLMQLVYMLLAMMADFAGRQQPVDTAAFAKEGGALDLSSRSFVNPNTKEDYGFSLWDMPFKNEKGETMKKGGAAKMLTNCIASEIQTGGIERVCTEKKKSGVNRLSGFQEDTFVSKSGNVKTAEFHKVDFKMADSRTADLKTADSKAAVSKRSNAADHISKKENTGDSIRRTIKSKEPKDQI